MKINLVYNKLIANYDEKLQIVEEKLSFFGLEYRAFEITELQKYGDIAIVIGGDGTMLKASKFFSEIQVPVLGINLGRLGFLSQTNIENVEKLFSYLIKGDYKIQERIMLTSNGKLALNDFVIKGCNTGRSSKFYLKINGEKVCNYIADGLIVSTPTGSTAYGLSAGGPVVYPTMDAIVIVPICPHTLNTRPLVIPSGEVITVKSSDKLLSLATDGEEQEDCFKEIAIRTIDTKVKLAFVEDESFYSVLKRKLHWGVSPVYNNIVDEGK